MKVAVFGRVLGKALRPLVRALSLLDSVRAKKSQSEWVRIALVRQIVWGQTFVGGNGERVLELEQRDESLVRAESALGGFPLLP